MRIASLEPSFDKSKGRWCVSVPPKKSPTGKRCRRYFDSEDEAKAESKRLKGEDAAHAALLRKVDPELLRSLVALDEELKFFFGVEGGLVDIGEEAKERLDAQSADSLFGAALDSFEAANSRNWSKSSKNSWKWIYSLVENLRHRRMSVLDSDFWMQWIRENAEKREWSPVTQKDVKGRLAMIWKYSMAKGEINWNPFGAVVTTKVRKNKKKATYEVEEVERLLECAWRFDREIVPYLAISIFAGLRPSYKKGEEASEITRLYWENVDFEKGHICVGAGFDNKTETKRFVPISDNLQLWLAPWRGSTGSVTPTNLRRRVEYVKWGKYQSPSGTPRKDWNSLLDPRDHYKDISRHTYGSYLEAVCHDPKEVMRNMGHTSPKTFTQHYREARTEEEGVRFWNIAPPTEDAETKLVASDLGHEKRVA